MLITRHFTQGSDEVTGLLYALYSITYQNYSDPSVFDAQYAYMLDGQFKRYFQHSIPFAVNDPQNYTSLGIAQAVRPNVASIYYMPYKMGVIDLYQAECIKYLSLRRNKNGRFITDKFLSGWLGVKPKTICTARRDPSVVCRECTVFDLMTDFKIFGVPRDPSKAREKAIKALRFNEIELKLSKSTMKRSRT